MVTVTVGGRLGRDMPCRADTRTRARAVASLHLSRIPASLALPVAKAVAGDSCATLESLGSVRVPGEMSHD